MTEFLVFTAILFVSLLVCMYGERREKLLLRGIGKMVASTMFLIMAIYMLRKYEISEIFYKSMGMIIGGLIFSWWGDLFLLWRHPIIFMLGLISFFLAHVLYIIAFLMLKIDIFLTLSALGILFVPAIAIGIWLYPNLGNMKIPVFAYMFIISVMVSLSIGAWGHSGLVNLPIGALMFYISDIFVARDRFKVHDVWNFTVGGILYYGGQVMLASSPLWISYYQ